MYHVIIISTVVVGDRAINGDIPGKIVTLLFIIINVVCSTEAASPGNLLLPCLDVCCSDDFNGVYIVQLHESKLIGNDMCAGQGEKCGGSPCTVFINISERHDIWIKSQFLQ